MTDQDYLDFLKRLKNENRLIFYAIRGSCLYGTNIATSDEDHHGIFHHDVRTCLGFVKPQEEASNEKHDDALYEIRKYVSLATTANPTVLDMFFTPDKYVLHKSDISDLLFSHKALFVTKKCYHSFSGYAYAQIAKASGKNKKVHSESKYVHEAGLAKLRELLRADQISSEWVEHRFSKHFCDFLCKDFEAPLTQNTDLKKMDECLSDPDIAKLLPPKREQFCYVVHAMNLEGNSDGVMPFRPQPLLEQTCLCPTERIDLETCNCSSVEHVGHVYRLYEYEMGARGVFHGGEVLCTSIPKEDEYSRFHGILIYAMNEYESARSEWRSFWEWMANRNEDRWKSEDRNENFEYDRKNMQHTIRLLLSAENIAVEGVPLIRFSGEKLTFLRDIREGKYAYPYLLDFAKEKVAVLRKMFDDCSLPYACNMKAVHDLYEQLVDMQLKKSAGPLA